MEIFRLPYKFLINNCVFLAIVPTVNRDPRTHCSGMYGFIIVVNFELRCRNFFHFFFAFVSLSYVTRTLLQKRISISLKAFPRFLSLHLFLNIQFCTTFYFRFFFKGNFSKKEVFFLIIFIITD